MIKLKLKYKELCALNEIWAHIDEHKPTKAMDKAMLSMMQDLSMKFQRKQLELQFKYDDSKEYSIKLKSYEAWFLEHYLNGISILIDDPFTDYLLKRIAGELNQKQA